MVSKWQTSMGALRIESMFAVFARQDACHIEYISASTQWKHIVCKRLRSQAYAVYAFTAHCDRVRFSFRVFSLEFLFSFWLHQSSQKNDFKTRLVKNRALIAQQTNKTRNRQMHTNNEINFHASTRSPCFSIHT